MRVYTVSISLLFVSLFLFFVSKSYWFSWGVCSVGACSRSVFQSSLKLRVGQFYITSMNSFSHMGTHISKVKPDLSLHIPPSLLRYPLSISPHLLLHIQTHRCMQTHARTHTTTLAHISPVRFSDLCESVMYSLPWRRTTIQLDCQVSIQLHEECFVVPSTLVTHSLLL